MQGESGMRRNQPVEVGDVSCPECSRPMQIRTGTTGVFLDVLAITCHQKKAL